jgi:metal-responsive CopG/Arc/MetJ family transcriptional regulator
MNKKVTMSAAWNLLTKIFGVRTEDQKELEKIVSKLNSEDSKKCLEAMVVQTLGEKIQQFMGANVQVQFVEK